MIRDSQRFSGSKRSTRIGSFLEEQVSSAPSRFSRQDIAQTIIFAPVYGPDDISTCLRMKKVALTMIVITIVIIDVVVVVVVAVWVILVAVVVVYITMIWHQ